MTSATEPANIKQHPLPDEERGRYRACENKIVVHWMQNLTDNTNQV